MRLSKVFPSSFTSQHSSGKTKWHVKPRHAFFTRPSPHVPRQTDPGSDLPKTSRHLSHPPAIESSRRVYKNASSWVSCRRAAATVIPCCASRSAAKTLHGILSAVQQKVSEALLLGVFWLLNKRVVKESDTHYGPKVAQSLAMVTVFPGLPGVPEIGTRQFPTSHSRTVTEQNLKNNKTKKFYLSIYLYTDL